MLLLALALLTRGPVLVGVTSESAWVAWETDAKQAGATVKLGTAAGAYPTTFQDDGYDMTHHVQLTGLLPGTTYHYIVDSDPQHADSTFTTPPPAPAHGPVRFVVYGDNRSNTGDHQRVVNAIRGEPGIAFLVHTGDMAQNYPAGLDQWTQFFQTEHDLLRNT